MARPVIKELTEDQLIARSTSAAFRPVSANTPAIPASYDGKFVLLCAIAVNVDATEAQMDGFETSVEAITGVHKAFILSGPHRIPVDRVPADHDLFIRAEAGFAIELTPVEP